LYLFEQTLAPWQQRGVGFFSQPVRKGFYRKKLQFETSFYKQTRAFVNYFSLSTFAIIASQDSTYSKPPKPL
jgi:hypothetical protein